MLEPEQQELLDLIKTIWESGPNYGLRFLQMIGNCTGPVSMGDIYFIDDRKLIEALKDQYDIGN